VIENQGDTKVGIAGIQVIDGHGKSRFPIPYSKEDDAVHGLDEKSGKEVRKQLVSEKISPGTYKTPDLSLQEQESLKYRRGA
jgi:hypothetical protein